MSIPSPYAQRTASEPREDCRDYLRTGRCKYGASCKYRHPPNVQSGGGMKAPLDPTEPMFPLRPNEPVCQYYMKHGTCKFGQACKFHHPPQSSVAALVGGGNLVMNAPRKPDSPQVMLNTTGTDANGVPLMLQFLPQRPDEQDCIYFLKNGRCKYGATCRYHHPINFHQRRQDVHQMQDSHVHPKLQYMSQPTAQMRYSHASNGSHMLVSDGAVSYVAVEGSQGKTYQPFSVALVNESLSHPVGLPLTVNQDHGSSSSSIASSYDTATSNLDHLHDPNALWNRQKGNGTLSAYPSEPNGRPHVTRLNTRMGLGQSGGDGTTGPLRHRAASYGSASDSPYFDASGVNRSGGSSLKSSHSSNSIRWRSDSNENRRRAMSQQFNVPADLTTSSSVPDTLNERVNGNYSRDRSRPPFLHTSRASRRSRQHPAEVDDGLTMMTSALLNMLDTPEEVAHESFDNLETFPQGRARADSTPAPNTTSGSLRYSTAHDGAQLYNQNDYDFSQNIEYPVNAAERGDFSREIPMLSTTRNGSDSLTMTHDDSANWVPSWQTSRGLGRPLEENAQTMSVIQPHHTTNTAHSQANVGLFIP